MFLPERLISLRTSLGINKAEAARRLNMSAMGYGRYESGEREPSYQTVSFIAQTFHCSVDYLYGLSDSMESPMIIVSASEEPDLFLLIKTIRNNNSDLLNRMLVYAEYLNETK
ncbi:MAG: helix-turn-helix transcriptional regulator [Lachnospiraceae bacterium]|nr:helix-turn-helix transcriptional regulator [Lachnospiraceae bacterium]